VNFGQRPSKTKFILTYIATFPLARSNMMSIKNIIHHASLKMP
jgi:hypothetical protein